jgi:hypothetical protein
MLFKLKKSQPVKKVVKKVIQVEEDEDEKVEVVVKKET